jgi:Do/DeqQ family serine protease
MRKMRIQIYSSQSLLTFGRVALVATLVLCIQPGSISVHAQSSEPVDELSAPLGRSSETFAPTVKKVAPAVVRIVTAVKAEALAHLAGGKENPALLPGLMPGARPGLIDCGLGSGVIVTEDGYILTNGHLVDGPREVKVTLQDGREFKARVIGLDPRSDIAVVKVDAQHLPTVPLAESRTVQVGDVVLAIGNPFGVGQTVTHGIVSATDRGGIGIEDYESFIQTDAPINPGNSGGALVDAKGRLIGINTAILSSSGGSLGIGFAVPSHLAQRVMTSLLKYGYVVRGYVGVEAQDLTPELAKEFKVRGATGVLVGGVVPRGPAEQAGLKAGDVITRFDSNEVRDARQMKLSVAETKPGETVAIEVLRDGLTNSLRIIIAQDFKNDLLAMLDRSDYEKDSGALEGVTIGELNSQLRQRLQIPRRVQGAIVLGINPLSAAAGAGLEPGDVIQSVNRHDIKNAAEASQLAQESKYHHTLLRVWSNSGSHFVLIP